MPPKTSRLGPGSPPGPSGRRTATPSGTRGGSAARTGAASPAADASPANRRSSVSFKEPRATNGTTGTAANSSPSAKKPSARGAASSPAAPPAGRGASPASGSRGGAAPNGASPKGGRGGRGSTSASTTTPPGTQGRRGSASTSAGGAGSRRGSKPNDAMGDGVLATISPVHGPANPAGGAPPPVPGRGSSVSIISADVGVPVPCATPLDPALGYGASGLPLLSRAQTIALVSQPLSANLRKSLMVAATNARDGPKRGQAANAEKIALSFPNPHTILATPEGTEAAVAIAAAGKRAFNPEVTFEFDAVLSTDAAEKRKTAANAGADAEVLDASISSSDSGSESDSGSINSARMAKASRRARRGVLNQAELEAEEAALCSRRAVEDSAVLRNSIGNAVQLLLDGRNVTVLNVGGSGTGKAEFLFKRMAADDEVAAEAIAGAKKKAMEGKRTPGGGSTPRGGAGASVSKMKSPTDENSGAGGGEIEIPIAGGYVPALVQQLFESIDRSNAQSAAAFRRAHRTVNLSFSELFAEEFSDLLSIPRTKEAARASASASAAASTTNAPRRKILFVEGDEGEANENGNAKDGHTNGSRKQRTSGVSFAEGDVEDNNLCSFGESPESESSLAEFGLRVNKVDLTSAPSTAPQATGLRLRNHPQLGHVIEGAQESPVLNYGDFLELVRGGVARRFNAFVKTNRFSHFVMKLTVRQTEVGAPTQVISTLTIIDTATAMRVPNGIAKAKKVQQSASALRKMLQGAASQALDIATTSLASGGKGGSSGAAGTGAAGSGGGKKSGNAGSGSGSAPSIVSFGGTVPDEEKTLSEHLQRHTLLIADATTSTDAHNDPLSMHTPRTEEGGRYSLSMSGQSVVSGMPAAEVEPYDPPHAVPPPQVGGSTGLWAWAKESALTQLLAETMVPSEKGAAAFLVVGHVVDPASLTQNDAEAIEGSQQAVATLKLVARCSSIAAAVPRNEVKVETAAAQLQLEIQELKAQLTKGTSSDEEDSTAHTVHMQTQLMGYSEALSALQATKDQTATAQKDLEGRCKMQRDQLDQIQRELLLKQQDAKQVDDFAAELDTLISRKKHHDEQLREARLEQEAAERAEADAKVEMERIQAESDALHQDTKIAEQKSLEVRQLNAAAVFRVVVENMRAAREISALDKETKRLRVRVTTAAARLSKIEKTLATEQDHVDGENDKMVALEKRIQDLVEDDTEAVTERHLRSLRGTMTVVQEQYDKEREILAKLDVETAEEKTDLAERKKEMRQIVTQKKKSMAKAHDNVESVAADLFRFEQQYRLFELGPLRKATMEGKEADLDEGNAQQELIAVNVDITEEEELRVDLEKQCEETQQKLKKVMQDLEEARVKKAEALKELAVWRKKYSSLCDTTTARVVPLP